MPTIVTHTIGPASKGCDYTNFSSWWVAEGRNLPALDEIEHVIFAEPDVSEYNNQATLAFGVWEFWGAAEGPLYSNTKNTYIHIEFAEAGFVYPDGSILASDIVIDGGTTYPTDHGFQLIIDEYNVKISNWKSTTAGFSTSAGIIHFKKMQYLVENASMDVSSWTGTNINQYMLNFGQTYECTWALINSTIDGGNHFPVYSSQNYTGLTIGLIDNCTLSGTGKWVVRANFGTANASYKNHVMVRNTTINHNSTDTNSTPLELWGVSDYDSSVSVNLLYNPFASVYPDTSPIIDNVTLSAGNRKHGVHMKTGWEATHTINALIDINPTNTVTYPNCLYIAGPSSSATNNNVVISNSHIEGYATLIYGPSYATTCTLDNNYFRSYQLFFTTMMTGSNRPTGVIDGLTIKNNEWSYPDTYAAYYSFSLGSYRWSPLIYNNIYRRDRNSTTVGSDVGNWFIFGPSEVVKAYNNTIDGCAVAFTWYDFQSPLADVTCSNNLVVSCPKLMYGASYNINSTNNGGGATGNPGANFVPFTWSSENDAWLENNVFVDYANADYNLLEGSEPVDAGTDVLNTDLGVTVDRIGTTRS